MRTCVCLVTGMGRVLGHDRSAFRQSSSEFYCQREADDITICRPNKLVIATKLRSVDKLQHFVY